MDRELAIALVLEDDHPHYDDYVFVVFSEDGGHVKHDVTAYYHIVKNKHTGDLYQIDYMASYEDGIDEDYIEYYPVEAREVTSIKYVPMK